MCVYVCVCVCVCVCACACNVHSIARFIILFCTADAVYPAHACASQSMNYSSTLWAVTGAYNEITVGCNGQKAGRM